MNSNDVKDSMYKLANWNGAYNGKVSGAGGGGLCFLLLNQQKYPIWLEH